MSLSSLSKLALVLHPTNCRLGQDLLLLLYSSVIRDEMWHLSLIGPATIAESHVGPRETWWEGKWSLEDLQQMAPSKSPDQLVGNIRSSFSNDDITLIGYREGNEAEVRIAIGYSTPDVLTIPLARLDPPSGSSPAPSQKPSVNLLTITCEAYRQLHDRNHAHFDNPSDRDVTQTMAQSSSSPQISIAPDGRTASKEIQQTISAQALFARNLANPRKKARVTVPNGFLPSDDSDS